jgi:ankyrin repeat protein
MTTSLPAFPSLDQLKRQAKDLVKRFKAQDAEASSRVQSHLPRAAGTSPEALFLSGLTLSEAQLVLAREHGFASWPRLKRHVEATQPDDAASVDAFKQAVQKGDAARLRTLFRTHPALKAQIDAPLFSFDSPAILSAASKSDRKMVDILLDNGADINARSQWWAGGFGVLPHDDPEFGSYLIERGAVVDVWAAAGMNRIERLQELIAADPACVNARGGDGQGPLHFAASVEAAKILLDHGADIDMRDIDHAGTPAQYMAAGRPEVCRYLLSRGAKLDIFMAVQLGDLDLVKQALAADPESRYAHVGQGQFTSGDSEGGHIYLYTLRNGTNPMFLAAELGHQDVYEFLLAQCTPAEKLLAACLRAEESVVQAIIAEHPDIVRTLPPEQMRLIADAAWAHKTEAVRLMLEVGFDVDARGDHQSTALNRAAVRGFADLIELLLAHGASLEARNEFGGRPLGACHWGAENFRDPNGDYARSIQLMLDAGAPLSDVHLPGADKAVHAVLRRYLDKLSRTNIIAAIKLGSETRTASLLDRDSDLVNRKTSELLPLYEAIRSGQTEIVRLLLDRGADPALTEKPDGPTAQETATKLEKGEIADMLRAPEV